MAYFRSVRWFNEVVNSSSYHNARTRSSSNIVFLAKSHSNPWAILRMRSRKSRAAISFQQPSFSSQSLVFQLTIQILSLIVFLQHDFCSTNQNAIIFTCIVFSQVTCQMSFSDPPILSGFTLCLLLSATALVFWRTGVDWATKLQPATGNLFTFTAEDCSCLVLSLLN